MDKSNPPVMRNTYVCYVIDAKTRVYWGIIIRNWEASMITLSIYFHVYILSLQAQAMPHKPSHWSISPVLHGPAWSTVWAGISSSFVGICMPTVSFLLGYIVMWPSVLTFFMSVARINPLRPPWMVAVSVEFGRETTARPDMNATHLMNSQKND